MHLVTFHWLNHNISNVMLYSFVHVLLLSCIIINIYSYRMKYKTISVIYKIYRVEIEVRGNTVDIHVCEPG